MYSITHTSMGNPPRLPRLFASEDAASDALEHLARVVSDRFGGVVSVSDTRLSIHKGGRAIFIAEIKPCTQ